MSSKTTASFLRTPQSKGSVVSSPTWARHESIESSGARGCPRSGHEAWNGIEPPEFGTLASPGSDIQAATQGSIGVTLASGPAGLGSLNHRGCRIVQAKAITSGQPRVRSQPRRSVVSYWRSSRGCSGPNIAPGVGSRVVCPWACPNILPGIASRGAYP
jgi:hypothetical protein